MKTKEEILKLWSDQEACPDFEPTLNEILNEREKLKESNEYLTRKLSDACILLSDSLLKDKSDYDHDLEFNSCI